MDKPRVQRLRTRHLEPFATDSDGGKLPRGVLSLRRGLRLLELLGEGGWSLADLARQLDVNKAIALRLLDELRNAAYVYRDDTSATYYLTYKLSNLGLRKLSQTRVLDQTNGVLRELANETGELVRLAVVEPDQRLTWVLAFTGARRSLHIDPNYRLTIGYNTLATGKAWLAQLPIDQVWPIFIREGLEPLTPHTKTDRTAIDADLWLCHERGFASSNEENELGVRAIAAPISIAKLSGERCCVGVVSVAAPTSRMTQLGLEAHPPLLKATVARLDEIWPMDDKLQSIPRVYKTTH
ncbi:MAG: IclR family transcriptional regulator [Limnohabitans sp.]|nr:IclR family transcriptional regulator [Limnohabitans sp.]